MKNIFIILSLILTVPSLALAGPVRKPSPPVQISIKPVQAGVTSDQIKPGDVIEFQVNASSFLPTEDLRIDVDLLGGAKLVSGELAWRGSANKGEVKTLRITIQVPENGKGTVRAKVSLPPAGGARFSSMAVYDLGPRTKSKPQQEHRIRKDSKGRDVIEYR